VTLRSHFSFTRVVLNRRPHTSPVLLSSLQSQPMMSWYYQHMTNRRVPVDMIVNWRNGKIYANIRQYR